MRTYFYYIISFLCLSACVSSHNDEEHDEGHHDHAGVEFSAEKAADFGVEYEIVSPGIFHDVIKTSGSIESSNADINTIVAKKSGVVTLNPGISIGKEVVSGERIGTVSSEGIQGGDVNKAADVNLQAAKKEYERLKHLFEEGLVTASVFREAERAYREAEALAGSNGKGAGAALISPASGSIQSLYVKSGEYVEVGNPIATVSKNSNLILKADLPARESRHLGELVTANFIPEGGDEVVRLADLDGKKVSGKTSAVSNGYIPVYFSFTGSPFSFPGGYAEVYLICGERNGVISVPRGALVEIQGNKYVYVAEDEDEYEKRLVNTGSTDGERIEILEGLKEGEKIVSKGASIIRMAEVSAIAPPSHTHNH